MLDSSRLSFFALDVATYIRTAMEKTKKFYTKDYLSRPGMSFAIDIQDPVQRIQAYMDAYKNAPVDEVCCIHT